MKKTLFRKKGVQKKDARRVEELNPESEITY